MYIVTYPLNTDFVLGVYQYIAALWVEDQAGVDVTG